MDCYLQIATGHCFSKEPVPGAALHSEEPFILGVWVACHVSTVQNLELYGIGMWCRYVSQWRISYDELSSSQKEHRMNIVAPGFFLASCSGTHRVTDSDSLSSSSWLSQGQWLGFSVQLGWSLKISLDCGAKRLVQTGGGEEGNDSSCPSRVVGVAHQVKMMLWYQNLPKNSGSV